MNNGISGALEAPSAYLMKSPPKQIPDAEAHDLVERFITQNARKAARARSAA
jgi:myo-inositol-1-phosphate synthase